MQHIKFYSNHLPGTFNLNGKTCRPGVLAQRMADYVDVYVVTRAGEYGRFRLETADLPRYDVDHLSYRCQCVFYMEKLAKAYSGVVSGRILDALEGWLTVGQWDNYRLVD